LWVSSRAAAENRPWKHAHAAEATGCRVARLGSPRIPVGYAQVLENEARLNPEKIARAARSLLDRG
jgi:pyruvate dehydrogenase E1 component beta subunit